MRRKLLGSAVLVLALLAVAFVARPADKTEAAPAPAAAIANATVDASCGYVNATYTSVIPAATQTGVRATPLGSFFPTLGTSFGILTTGSYALADDPNTATNSGADLNGPNVRGNTDYDVVILRIDCTPAPSANCLSFDFAFYSEEYPEWVGTAYNDAFIAELNTTSWTTSGSAITAPNNFAFDPANNPVTINSSGVANMTAANAVGTTYDGATSLLTAKTTFTANTNLNGANPGNISLYLSIFDQGDRIYDSAVFLDRIRAGTVNQQSQCAEGAQQAEICDNGIDDDGDTLVDGNDPDCPEVSDFEKTSVDAVGPTEMDVSEDEVVTVTSVVTNNGDDPGSATDTLAATAPADCTVTPAQYTDIVTLPAEASETIIHDFTIHCFEKSDHTFTFCNTIAIIDGEDPVASNNGPLCDDVPVAVFARADLEAQSVSVDCPVTEAVGTPFDCTVEATVHNNGPYGPADGTTTISLSGPADCTIVPATDVVVSSSLAVSASLVLSGTWSVTCEEPSFHDFAGNTEIVLDPVLHLADPDPDNNSASGVGTTAITDSVDIELTGGFDCPDNVDAGVEFICDVSVAVSNPAAYDVLLQITLEFLLPDDCTSPNPTSAVYGYLLPPGGAADEAQWHFTCTEPSNHTITFNYSVEVDQEHVTDPVPENNSISISQPFAVFADADLKVVSVDLDCPPAGDAGTPFDCDVEATVHNNGPYGPVSADVTFNLSVPGDCTIVPPGDDIQSVSLAVSISQTLSSTWTVTCTDGGSHNFLGTASVEGTQLHVDETDSDNNSDSQGEIINLEEQVEEADLKVVSVVVGCPVEANAGTAFSCTVQTTVHNNGPDGPTTGNVVIDIVLPIDCVATPAGSQTETGVVLVVSTPVVLTKTWSVTCTNFSNHTIGGTATIANADPLVVDPTPSNNSGNGSTTVPVFANADLKVVSVSTECGAEADINAQFSCSVSTTVHNNGPVSPAAANVDVSLSTPFDCDKVPAAGQTQAVNLATSVAQTVVKSWNVTCHTQSSHTFTGGGTIAVNQLHVRDTVSSNNMGNGADTIPVYAYTDVKTPSIVVSYPAIVAPGQQFQVDVTVSIHNNGPFAALQGEGGAALALPPDCAIVPNSYQLFNPIALPASVTVQQTESWAVTCADAGTHQATACGRAGPVTLHVRELSTNNAAVNLQFTIVVGTAEPAVYSGIRCTILGDPPEQCGNGVDDDQDGLIDEEPDVDGDGLSDCVDSDADGDAYPDSAEVQIGTNPWNACPQHPFDKAWPPDLDNSRSVNISDVLALKPAFNSQVGQANYSARKDLVPDGRINISDVLKLKPAFGHSCTN